MPAQSSLAMRKRCATRLPQSCHSTAMSHPNALPNSSRWPKRPASPWPPCATRRPWGFMRPSMVSPLTPGWQVLSEHRAIATNKGPARKRLKAVEEFYLSPKLRLHPHYGEHALQALERVRYSGKPTCPMMARASCPRTRASSPCPRPWIPACAGMTFPCGLDGLSRPIAGPATCITRSSNDLGNIPQ